jgi:pimeloyl-ACP methyl ester carboxylesterase
MEWGSGDKTALLLHGISSNKEGWWRVGPAIAELGYRVTALDLRGHGANDHPESMTLEEYVADILELVPTADLLLGHSLGGAIAIRLLTLRPEFCDRLILEDPALMLNNSPTTVSWLTADFDRAGSITKESVLANAPTWHPTDAGHKADALIQSGREAVIRTLNSNPSINLVAELVAVSQPTLLLGADPTSVTLVPPALGEGVVALNENVSFAMIPNSSHSIHRDECEAMLRLIGAWHERDDPKV